MRVGIVTDAMGDISTGSGISHYIYRLTEHLLKLDRKNEYVLIHRKFSPQPIYKQTKELIYGELKTPFGLKIFEREFRLRYAAARSKIDVFHDTANSGLPVIPVANRCVQTVHDVIPLVFPSMTTNYMRMTYRVRLPLVLKKADRIIVISNSTKRDLVRLCGVGEDKITTIYYGIDSMYQPAQISEVEATKQKLGIEGKFILHVSVQRITKNIPRLLQAFAKLRKMGRDEKLVQVGSPDPLTRNEIANTITALRLQHEVMFTGPLPAEMLPPLYTDAELFVFPSLYEGFGFPPAEAMACGCPVVASNASSLPEIVGDSGILVNPYDVNALTDAMFKVLTDETLKNKLRQKGFEQVKKFSWKRAALKHIEIYRELCEG